MLRLGGIRIDTNTNGLHLAPYYLSFALKRLPDGADIRIATPKDAKLGAPVWSPDGKQFAFTNTTPARHRAVDRIVGHRRHAPHRRRQHQRRTRGPRQADPATSVEWLGDNRTLHRQPGSGRTRRRSRRTRPSPEGPHVQESLGHAGPAPTL